MNDLIVPFKVQFSQSEINEFLKYAKDIVSHGALIPGKYNNILETEFAKFIGTKYAVTVITGTTALEIIYRCLDLGGHDVLIPANTNYATAEAVQRAGGNVVLYDSDLYPDFNHIRQNTTKKTKALVVVHIGGYITPEIEKIVEFCRDNNIFLIEDASHAHGSKFNGKSAGTFGFASAFSMFATKIVTTSEGGIIVSNEKTIKELSTIYRDQGKDIDGIRNIVFGSAWRMSELHASLGIPQIRNINTYIEKNNKTIQFYIKNLVDKKINIPFNKNNYYSGYKFIITLENEEQRNSLKDYLLQNNIRPGKNVYDVPLHLQPALKITTKDSYPKAEHFARTHLCLPIWKGIENKEVKKIVEIVNNWSNQIK